MIWLQLAAGLALLLGGGEALVKGSVAVATRFGVSPLLIGLTLVGFGTSTPELVASLEAALSGRPGIAVGNVVGSNIANILLILGVSAVIYPMATTKEAFRRDGAVLIGAALVFTAAVLYEHIGRLSGGAFLILLLAYTVFTFFDERTSGGPSADVHAAEAAEVMPAGMSMTVGVALTVGGIAAIVYGASLLIGSAVEIARAAQISETVIGLTLVAIGTSLPELVTSLMAALRRHTDVAFGNLVGSNIFNSLGIAGATAVVTPIDVPPEIAVLDIWVMIAASLTLVLFATTGWRVNRWEGALFLVAYGVYIAVLLSPPLRATLGLS